MDSFIIATPLRGDVTISGSKNAVLPIMAATLLTGETCTSAEFPNLSDVTFMVRIRITRGRGHVGPRMSSRSGPPESRALRLRSYPEDAGSICILGPLLGRRRAASVSLPGGCVIGTVRLTSI